VSGELVGLVVGAVLGWLLARLLNEPKRSKQFFRPSPCPHGCGTLGPHTHLRRDGTPVWFRGAK
jgi:prepilin signal peptidase PulO-like enzyme (type II secretory pathway)